jgi:hypothetical protein
LGKTLLGASAFMHMNYVDTRSGEAVGPTLLHVAVTNRPYVVGLEDYAELIAASADGGDRPVVLSRSPTNEETTMELPELKRELLRHGVDLDALQLTGSNPASAPSPAAFAQALREAGVSLSLSQSGAESEITGDEVVAAVAEIARDNIALSRTATELGQRLQELERSAVATEVKRLVADGYIVPAKESAYLELALTNRVLFDTLIPSEPVVKLANEIGHSGAGTPPAADSLSEAETAATIARYTAPGGVLSRLGVRAGV